MLEHFGFGDFVFRRARRDRGGPRRRPARASRRSWPRCPRSRSSTTPSATTSRAGSRRAPSSPSPTSCGRGRSPTTRAPRPCARASSARSPPTGASRPARWSRDFDRGDFDLSGDFYRIGGGSLGRQGARPRLRAAPAGRAGPARPLRRASRSRCRSRRCSAPTSSTASSTTTTCAASRSSARTTRRSSRRFLAAPFPSEAAQDVAAFLERATLAARRALVEPARGLAAPAVHRRLRHPDAGEQRVEPSASGVAPRDRGDQARLRLDLLASTRRPTSRRRPTGWRRRRWR